MHVQVVQMYLCIQFEISLTDSSAAIDIAVKEEKNIWGCQIKNVSHSTLIRHVYGYVGK